MTTQICLLHPSLCLSWWKCETVCWFMAWMAQTFLREDVQSEKKVDSIEVKAPAKRLPDGIAILKDVMTREPGLERNMTDIDRWEIEWRVIVFGRRESHLDVSWRPDLWLTPRSSKQRSRRDSLRSLAEHCWTSLCNSVHMFKRLQTLWHGHTSMTFTSAYKSHTYNVLSCLGMQELP